MTVLVTGTIGYDYILNFSGRFADRIMPDKIHQLSLSFLVDKLSKQFGGTAVNIAYSLKLLDTEPFILSSAGNDFAPYKKHLHKYKITTSFISINKKIATGSYFVVTDREDNQIGAFYKGATIDAQKLSVARIKEKVDFAIISPTDKDAMLSYCRECQQLKISYMFDPAFQIGDFSKTELQSAIEGAAMLIGNDYEIALIEKKVSVESGNLVSLVPIVITTLGSKGAHIATLQKKITIKPATAKNVSDPTGAGDAFRAGFVAGYLRGLDLKTCGQMGAVAAVYTVEKYGTQTHEFTLEQFKKRYKENYKVNLPI